MNDFLPYISPALDNTLLGLWYLLPELTLALFFILVILVDIFSANKKSTSTFGLALIGVILSSLFSFNQLNLVSTAGPLFGKMIVLDRLAILFKLIFSLVSVLFILFIRNNRQLKDHKKGSGDLYMILLAVQLGLHLMAMSSSLVMIYITIEMVSIGSYLMVGYVSGDNKQTEAAMKYALFGGVCSAVMLYGMSLLYAFSGTLAIHDAVFIANLMAVSPLGVGVAIILILVGIGFKLALVPFHFWSPDVYEGAPTPVTAFLSTGPKVAGFAILIRFLTAFQTSGTAFSLFDFNTVLAVVAIITMLVGNFAAIWQNNIKRMLAYSSIGHTGFILMAIPGLSPTGYSAIIFYLFIYALMNMAAFMLADRIEEQTGAITINEYRGLGKKLKIELFCFVIILLSLTGLPPTAGFVAKFLIFSSALEYYTHSHSAMPLVVVAVGALTTVVALFYYFKIPLNAYLRDSQTSEGGAKWDTLLYIILMLTLLMLAIGIFPGPITRFISDLLS